MFQLLVSLFALLIIALTMLASASDLKLKGFRWNARRVGFISAGTGAVALLWTELFLHHRPSVAQAALHLGVALILMTNPYQPPWHKWIWKGDHGGVA